MKRICTSLFALVLVGSSGCGFYFSGDDDDNCNWGGGPVPGDPLDLRNPETGQCESFGTWTECDDPCQPCPGTPETDAIAMPSWAYCDSYCEGLDELTCMSTAGCRAAYLDDCMGTDCADTGKTFYACWGTDQSGAIQGGGCEGLDAWECSRHDDCSVIHYNNGCLTAADAAGVPVECDPLGYFEACIDESIVCDEYNPDVCPEGTYCNATEVCLPYPGCDDGTDEAPGLIDCEAACAGFCVPEEPHAAGNCYEEALCDMVEPECPADTLPGVADGCYTGYCIPIAECPDDPPPPPTACTDIADEATCISREDCTAYYEGVDCDCDANGTCECADWIFVECE